MITYELGCSNGHRIEVTCSIKDYETLIKPGMDCRECGGRMHQRVSTNNNRAAFRPSFPKGPHEVALPTEHGEAKTFRDKHEASDYLQSQGLTSRWIENDM